MDDTQVRRIIYGTTAMAVGDLCEAVPSAAMDLVLMQHDQAYKPQQATIDALRQRNLIDHGDRPHDLTIDALVVLAARAP